MQKWGNMDGFRIVVLQTLTVPRDDNEMLHQAEATAIATLRAQGFELQNHNAPRLVTSHQPAAPGADAAVEARSPRLHECRG